MVLITASLEFQHPHPLENNSFVTCIVFSFLPERGKEGNLISVLYQTHAWHCYEGFHITPWLAPGARFLAKEAEALKGSGKQ